MRLVYEGKTRVAETYLDSLTKVSIDDAPQTGFRHCRKLQDIRDVQSNLG